MSTHTEEQRCEDTCPACDEPIDWEDGWHELDNPWVRCNRVDVWVDYAVVELEHLAAS